MHKSAFVLIEKDGGYLLIQEGGGRREGMWSMPGGHIDEGEDAIVAGIREAEEEAGVKVVIKEKLFEGELEDNVYQCGKHRGDVHYTTIFKAEYISGEPKHGTEEMGVRWLMKEDLLLIPIRFTMLIDLI